MNNKAVSRNKAIYELLKKYKDNEEIKNLLSRGFIPESVKVEYNELWLKYMEETKGLLEDSDYDMSLFSNYFYLNDNKLIGEEKQGSGYINPIKTVGNIDMINDFILENPIEINQSNSNNLDQEKKLIEMEKNKIIDDDNNMSMNDIVILNQLKSEKKSTNKSEELWNIEDCLKEYSPQITEAEIKGHVWYKQKYGTPMFGWEKYFIGNANSVKGNFCITKKATKLKNQQFQDVRLVPSGTNIGVKTRFKNEYSGITYCVVKSENNDLFYVNEDDFVEEKSIATVDESLLIELVNQKGLCFDGEEYLPLYIYTKGSIFDIKDKFYGKYNSETLEFEGGANRIIEQKFGKKISDWHESLIKEAESKLRLFDFSNPIISERPYLSKENELSSSFMINELDIDCGVSIKKHFDEIDSNKRWKYRKDYSEESKVSLFEAFEIWFGYSVTDAMVEKTSVSDIKNYYFSNKGVSIETEGKKKKDIDKEKDEIKINARLEGERFYSEFLSSSLQRNDLLALNRLFNANYNNIIPIDASKVPVAFSTNKRVFNSDEFKLKPVQRDGLAFMSVNNCGVMAYDVGFGKTLCSIHNLASLLQTGQVKRPLIAVPKQVYKNWIYEMFGYWTNGDEKSENEFKDSYFVNGALTGTKYKLNKWFNLGVGYEQKNKIIDEYTITLVTYQGLSKIGFSEKLYEELSKDIYSITKIKYDSEGQEVQRSERQQEKEIQNAESILGKALAKTELDIDVLGFDYMILDEAHNFKNIFSSVFIPEGQRNVWRLSNGTISSRGIKAFVLSLYLQKKYNGAVNLLTATPFTNSVLEIFSMFSLVAYNYLEKSSINNVFQFMSMFIETQVEYTVDATNKIELNTVIKSFKNKNILRDLLYNFFDYQDNPILAGIKRPCKINFPNKSVTTLLQMSTAQELVQFDVQEEAMNYSPENKGAVGRALAWAKSNAFSPYSSKAPSNEGFEDIDQFISESPKIDFTIRCIKSVKDWHEKRGQSMSGQVIYSNRGKELFSTFKKALEQECGFLRKVKFGEEIVDEVEIITGSGSDAEVERKEIIKDAFNQGIVKVIIGTATIQEGINLQRRGTVLYNLDLDWNPTAFKQLEGRIHRQGNLFKYVRIVVPMIQGTLDSFINQKLDEKSKRIADIWDKNNTENSVEVTDAVDPMELKFNLIKDENELMKMRYDIEYRKQLKLLSVAKDKYDSFETLEKSLSDFMASAPEIEEKISEINKEFKVFLNYLERFVDDGLNKKIQTKTILDSIERLKQRILKVVSLTNEFLSTREYKLVSQIKTITNYNFSCDYKKDEYSLSTVSYSNLKQKYEFKSYSWLPSFSIWSFERFMGAFIQCKKIETNVLKPYGLKFTDDFSGLKEQFLFEKNNAEKIIEFLNSEDYKLQLKHEIRIELEKRQKDIGSIQDRVDDFMKTNYLLSFPFDESDANNCNIPEFEDVKDISFVKENLEVDEFIDIDDISEKTTLRKLKKIQDFIPKMQLSIVKSNITEFMDVINDLYKQIIETPISYETEGIPMSEKIAKLHYFYGGSDWYVIEIDKDDAIDEDSSIKNRAFGYVVLNNDLEMSEFGYFDINELKSTGKVELDFYFTPKTISELIPSKFELKQKEELPIIEEPKQSKVEQLTRKVEAFKLLAKIQRNEDKKALLERKVSAFELLLKMAIKKENK